jgi:hypothetical protein
MKYGDRRPEEGRPEEAYPHNAKKDCSADNRDKVKKGKR